MLCLSPGEAFGPSLDDEEHLAFHYPRAWFDDRVGELVLPWQGGGVKAVAADQPSVIARVGRRELDQQHGSLIAQLVPACPDALGPGFRRVQSASVGQARGCLDGQAEAIGQFCAAGGGTPMAGASGRSCC